MAAPKRRRSSIIGDGLNRGTAWLYAAVIRSHVGRLMTGYRKADAALMHGPRYTGRQRCNPASPARIRVVEAIESSLLAALIRAFFSALLRLPTNTYGMFGLYYGLFGVLAGIPFRNLSAAPSGWVDGDFIAFALIALISIPLACTRKPLGETLSTSLFLRPILFTFLGIPEEAMVTRRLRFPAALPYLTFLIALPCALLSEHIHPAAVPLAILLPGVLGLIFSYPEAGVILSTAMLPLLWLNRNTVLLLAVVILLTWIGYGIKLLSLHRTIRLGLLDTTVLLFGILILVSSFTGAVRSSTTVLQSLLLTVCLSDYFLIVNLMTTRAHIRRCLYGVVVSVALVTVLSYLRLIPVDGLAWLEGSPAGDLVIETFTDAYARLSSLWVEHSALFLVLVFPWLLAFLFHTKRLRRWVLVATCIGLDLALVLMSGSVSAPVCVLFGSLVFLLLMSHKWLSAGIVSLPLVGCGALWLRYLYPVSDSLQTVLSRSRWYRGLLNDSMWRMVLDHPAGIGLGEECFAAVYPAYASPWLEGVTDFRSLYFEILLGLGWPGLLLFCAVIIFFIQKSLTCLHRIHTSRDRAMIIGGLAGVATALVFGIMRSFISSPRVFFTVFLSVALCSAFENILFDEDDIRAAETPGSPEREDRLFRRGI